MGLCQMKNGDKSKNPETKRGSLFGTKTVESGAFIRTTYRRGNKRKTKTQKMTKNQKKVVLGHIGDFEVYVYPYDYPDSVFLGNFPVSTQIDLSSINQFIRCYNLAKSYLKGTYFERNSHRKEANSRRQAIQSAYNRGLPTKPSSK